jgi:hypothetical protein
MGYMELAAADGECRVGGEGGVRGKEKEMGKQCQVLFASQKTLQ